MVWLKVFATSIKLQNMHRDDGYFSPQWLHIEMRGEFLPCPSLTSKWHEIISPKITKALYGHSNKPLLSQWSTGWAHSHHSGVESFLKSYFNNVYTINSKDTNQRVYLNVLSNTSHPDGQLVSHVRSQKNCRHFKNKGSNLDQHDWWPKHFITFYNLILYNLL